MMKAVRRRIILLSALLIACSGSAAAQSTLERPLITVTGQAEVKVAPDEVVFNLEVETLNKELAAAKALNDESVRKVLALARKYEIPASNVQTDYISVVPRYYEPSGPQDRGRDREFLGYEVSKRIVIILRDVSRTEGLLSDVLTTGVNYVRGVQFRSTQIRKMKDQARMLAIRAAQEKAIALTREIGQTIGKAYSIREDEPGRYDNMMQNTTVSGGGASSSMEESTIALGQISIQARVVVSFELK